MALKFFIIIIIFNLVICFNCKGQEVSLGEFSQFLNSIEQKKSLRKGRGIGQYGDRVPPEISGEHPDIIIGPLGETIPEHMADDYVRLFVRERGIDFCPPTESILKVFSKSTTLTNIKLDLGGGYGIELDVNTTLEVFKHQQYIYTGASDDNPLTPKNPICGLVLESSYKPVDSFSYSAVMKTQIPNLVPQLNEMLPAHKSPPGGQCVGEKATSVERDTLMTLANLSLALVPYPFIEQKFIARNGDFSGVYGKFHLDSYKCVKDHRNKTELGGLVRVKRYFSKYKLNQRKTYEVDAKFKFENNELVLDYEDKVQKLYKSEILKVLKNTINNTFYLESDRLHLSNNIEITEEYKMKSHVNGSVAAIIDLILKEMKNET